MRRSQFDNGSQPVRNLFANPGCETASGLNNVLVRTNSCTDPACETSTGTTTLRTNLATNPRGVLTLPDYSGVSNQTITPNIAITNHPEGIATANRVEYAANATNPGVAVLNPAEASATYTLSAWVYHETAPASHGGQAFAQAGIASQPTPPAITQGQWTRVSWTTTTGASPSYFGFRVASPTTAGAFLITGILIEKAPGLTPFFDGSTTRTNLCTNPSFATDLTGWGGISASLTRVTNQGGDGHVAEVAQTLAGGVRQGGIFLNGANLPAGTYTVAFDVKGTAAEFTNVRALLYDPATTSSWSATTPLIKDGNYNRYSFQITTTGVFDRVYMEVQGTNIPVGTKAWIDHALIEGKATKGFYFEGAGDITYAWTGTANASTSTEKAPAISRYTLENGGIAYRDSSYQMTGRHSIKMLGGQGDFYQIAASTTPATWTFSCSYKTDGTVTGTPRLYIRGNGTSQPAAVQTNLPLTQTTPGRFSATVSTATGTTGVVCAVFAPTTGDIWIDDILMEQAPSAAPHFDGSTPAAGDFNYAWQGTANASTSIMRGNGVATFAGGSGGGTAFIQSSEWAASGTKSCRIIPGPNANADTYQNVPPGYTLPPGTYTIMATLRLPAAQTGTLDSASRARRIVAYHSNTSIMSPQAPNTPGVYPLRVTFKVTDGTVYQSFRLYNGAAFGGGDVWWDNIMLVEGDYQGGYIDPSQNLLAKWEGAANASKSVGYPPQLLDIAGAPTLDQIGPGNSATIAVDGFAARTLYAVYEVTDINAGSWQVPFAYGPAPSTDGFTLQSNAAGQSSMAPRADFATGGGQANASLVITGRTAGRVHVVAFAFPQGLTGVTANTDGGGDVTRTYTPGTVGWPNHRAAISNPAGGMKGLRGLVYMGEHDRATRIAISRYLGNKYGAAVA